MNLPVLNIGGLVPKLPIIQGGMGIGVSLGQLAGAVAKEGGIGIISTAQIGFMESDFKSNLAVANVRALVKEIRKAREIAPDGIIGVNIMVATRNYAEMVMTCVSEKIDLIISGAGLPKTLPDLVKGSEVKIVPIVSSRRAAETIAKLWEKKYNRLPDAFVIEGPKAGGHLGFSKEELTSDNVPDVYDITRDVKAGVGEIPVITAGGVYDGADMLKAFEAGASGVQMSTRFVATVECDAHQNFKDAYIQASKEDIKLVTSPVGLPGRAIRNKFTEALAEKGSLDIDSCFACITGCSPATAPYCITDVLVKSVLGDAENGLVFAGENAHRLTSMTTVPQLMKDLVDEYEIALKK